MKRVFLIALLAGSASLLYGASQFLGVDTNQAATINGVAGNASVLGMALDAAGGGGSTLLSDGFEAADGTNLSGYNSWAGDSVNNIEIDTAQFDAGASSLLRNGSDTNACYKTFATVSSGKVNIKGRFRIASTTGEKELWVSSAGAFSWGGNNWPIMPIANGSSLAYHLSSSSGDTVVGGATFTANTWATVEVQIDRTANQFSIWFDGTLYVSGSALTNTGINVDRITFSDNTSGVNVHVDELLIYTGERIP